MAKAKKLQENGIDIIPVTHESIVFDDNGVSIPDKYQTIEDAIHVEDFGEIDDVELDINNRLCNVEKIVNELYSEGELKYNNTIYPHQINLNNYGIIGFELEGRTEVLDNSGNEIELGNINANLKSVNDINIAVNDTKILLCYNDDGVIKVIKNLCKYNDEYMNTIEKHEDGKYYYHERCRQVELNNVQTIYNQIDANQVEGFITCFIIPADYNASDLKPHSAIICDKIDSCSDNIIGSSKIWSNNEQNPVEFLLPHSSASFNIRLSNDKAIDSQGVKNWLNENKPNILFILNEELIYECYAIEFDVDKGVNTIDINCTDVLPNVKYNIKQGGVELLVRDSISQITTFVEKQDNNYKTMLLTNKLYNNNTVILDNIIEYEDITEIINESLLLDGIDTVILPNGYYYISGTIDIPANKKLIMQGTIDKKSDMALDNNINTILELTTNNVTMIKMHTGSLLEGGYLYLNKCVECQAIKMDLWNENCVGIIINNTKIKGGSNRTYNQTGVLLECDPEDGVTKNGYGLYCDFNISMSNLSICYHLHRHNATWTDGPDDIVWLTDCKFRGWLVHSNRYVWFDTVGGWGGDSSTIEATIQCGAVVGEDYPGIELNCSGVNITGNLWDFGGDGLQQTAIKLNERSEDNLITNDTRTHSEDNGKNNIFRDDLYIDNNISTNYLSILDSLYGNEEKFNIIITTTTVEGLINVYNGIKDFEYDNIYGFNVYGITNLERLFSPLNTTKHTDRFAHVDNTKISKLEIKIIFNANIALKNIGCVVGEISMPTIVDVYATYINAGEQHVIHRDLSSLANKNSSTCEGEYCYVKNMDDYYRETGANTFSKAQLCSQVRWVFEGFTDLFVSNNLTGSIGKLLLDVHGILPNTNVDYIIDDENMDIMFSKSNKSIFGEKLYSIDFSEINEDEIDGYIYANEFKSKGGIVTLEDGCLKLTPSTECSDADIIIVRNVGDNGDNIVLYDVEYNFNNTNKMFYLMGDVGYRCSKGRRLSCSFSGRLVSFRKITLEEGEYFKVHKITIYKKPTKFVHYPKLNALLFNYYEI